ncbi:ATP-binding cassette sub-family A member 9-like [Leptonychotes weddellii]|uniref:ATP-binding cassette sub-family A member 9-like n=1 Tax=Leptonychotes weddellii TaxID=9713 RepID=A0A7F8QMY7_LEPWE|nr:ATP-binding cassette sub-family A member 9-like [Leptonychotes weddellii]
MLRFCARLSWGLMYAGFIFIVATLMALIVKSAQVVVLTGFVVVFTLFLLYGLSLITLAFLMSVLIKKPFLTGLVVFLLTVFWGSLGFTALYRHLPAFLEWTLCLLSPFAFTAGMAELIHLDYDVNSNIHLDSSDNPYLIIATLFVLVFDALLYLALTLYFDKILPTEYGHRCSPWFFLKSSFWFQHQRAGHLALENEIDSDSSSNDSFEPVSPEFHGKEAIRIRNLRKEYGKGNHEKVEALKGLVFDIYEGQITALLGHSGAGKTTLLNMLSGLSEPTSGSVTIYNHTLSEMTDSKTVSKLTGVCPQSNVQFGFLTVKENLRLFAKIKGIQPHEVEQEMQQVLRDLEMENIQDILAQNLSGGQKRKLTFGIAILGDPQVLLLDEPTAGSDPLSRHCVWNLLKERKSDRVILFSTQFMDEADILADRKVFISNGRLKCAGSSLFLKKKWGIGYHLSLHLNEMCDPDNITSLVKQHIPDAKLTAQSEEKLIYILPLERTNKFPVYRKLIFATSFSTGNLLLSHCFDFRISPRSSGIFPNPEEPEGEDEDVQIERRRTTNAGTVEDFDEKPVIIASCLRKEYAGKKRNCFAKRKKKVAIRNVSFCVKKGEVIGLLGHNGAGKSTTIKMIIGDTNPTAGQVILKGSSEGDSLGFLGYCPQENVLWPNLSVREHLEVFAAIKGLKKGDATVTITRLVDALKLQDQLKLPVKALSEGIKRKVCFVLSILGNPSVVLLDEPSTGMDPEGQQQMWQAIRATFRNTERGALLTTHYMAEAEAVCDRVAIMVSGRLRCIGSIQHLKSKFGKEYLLEMKVKTPAQVEPLHCEILRLFPQAARQERYSSLMVYKLPVEDVHPLSQAFFKLEIVKQSFDLEEYSLSQSTLEQVFLELSKEQELDDFEEELDPSVKRKLLPQEDP